MSGKQVNPDSIDYYPFEKLEKTRRSLSRLYTFIKRYVRKTISLDESGTPYVLALFSNEGILLDLYAKDKLTLEWFARGGVRAGGDWSTIGYNAAIEGLRSNRSLASVGEEHENEILKELAVYFAPIRMLSPYEPYDPMEQCGVAIIAPKKYAWAEFLTMIRGTAHDMMITLQFNNIATMYYERSGRGVLSIDNMMSHDGTNLATYYNDELFRVLEVEPISMYYQPVEALIDPLPSNQELWEIVRNHRTISNYPMRVTVHGRDIDVIATTDAFNQPSINAHGVTFYFTTQQKITAELSDKVANGAIKTFDDIVGSTGQIRDIIHRAKKMALTDSNIMLLGESGTGKDIFAQAIHNASPRRNKPFVALNCGALPRDLIESELFGYESGAFSGARKNGNIGKFELANGGTIFLDEIGEMPLDLQVRLLRITEQKQFMRLGGSKLIKADVRIIAATNANIEEMINQRQFRADLFYRLSTMKLNLPALRERKEDILPLAEHFIRQISQKIDKPNIMRFSKAAADLMVRLDWTGNIRELQNLVECIVQIYPGDIILPEYIMDNVSYNTRKTLDNPMQRSTDMGFSSDASDADIPLSASSVPVQPRESAASHFSSWPGSAPSAASVPEYTSSEQVAYPYSAVQAEPLRNPASPHMPEAEEIPYMGSSAAAADQVPGEMPASGSPTRIVRHHRKLSKDMLLEALRACGNNRSAAAEYLGISRRTMYRKMEEFGIE